MKPNFALSLLFEGIRLLHRTGSGPASVWTLVGEVAIDAPDLASQLAILRKTGLALDPQGLRCKLLIPNDQIKYLSLDTTRSSDDDVRRALDGATPFTVDDLYLDHVRGGGRTYIAAVAKETLAEAEAFAAEHRFGPVSFAGVPEPFTYMGEPFFGLTSIAERLLGSDQTVERDEAPVLYMPKTRQSDQAVSGPLASKPAMPLSAEPPLDSAPLILTGAPADRPKAATDKAAASPALSSLADVEPETPVLPKLPAQTDPTANPISKVNLAPPETAALTFTPQAPTIFDTSVAFSLALPNLPDPTPDDAPFIDVPPESEPEPDLAVASPIAKTAQVNGTTHDATALAPVLTDLTSAQPEAAVAMVSEPTANDATGDRPSLVPDPVFASRGRTLRADATDFPAMRQPLPPPPGSRTPNAEMTEPMFNRRAEPPLSRPGVPTAPPLAAASVDDIPVPAFTSRTAMIPPRLTGAARMAPDPAASRPFNAKLPLAETAPAVTGTSGATRPSQGVAATVIPFRPTPDGADQAPATPVSIQTVSLSPAKSARPIQVPGSVTAPALDPGELGAFAKRHGGAAQAGPKGPAVSAASPSQPGPQPQAQTGVARAPAGRSSSRTRPRYLALILTLILLAFLAAVAAWASYLTPNGLAGLFGSGTDQTEVALTPAALPPAEPSPLTVSDLTATTLAAPQDTDPTGPALSPVLDQGPALTTLPALIAPVGTTDTVATLPPDDVAATPAPPATAAPADELIVTESPVAPDVAAAPEPGTAVSPAEADRIYAATGVWLRAPRLPLIPTVDPVGTLARAGADIGVVPVTQPVMPALSGSSPDQAMLTPIDPPAPGTVFQRDARGFVLATPEGTLTPDGILVFAGTPSIIPPNRPGTPEPVVVLQAAPRIIAASAPPLAPRPATAAPDAVAIAPDKTALDLAEPSAGGVGLDSLAPLVRPLVRPETVLPTTAALAAEALPASPILVAFAGPAPQLRPAGLTPETVAFPNPAQDQTTPQDGTDPSAAIEDTVAAILAATPPEPVITGTPLAVASARIPEARPQNFAEVVASAQQRSAPAAPQNPSLAVIDPPPAQPEAQPEVQPEVQPAAQPEIVPESAVPDEVVAPSGPIPGGVAANATLAEAIDLRAVNLIGVYGRPNDRRALVRLANGRFVRVGVGDSLDGGQVAAIGDNALNYVKSGRTITIAIPNG